jgi:uncharacterized protein (TIGR02996 family)
VAISSDDGRALRAAIWADPAGLEPYGVYADWLTAQGISHGEYIQLSLIANPTPEQSRRAAALLKKDRGGWLGAARPFVRSWTHDARGFVATAVCEAPQVAAGFAQLLELGPRLRLAVTGMAKRKRATVAALAALPLGRCYGLALATKLDDRDLAELAPALAGITHLDLGYNDFTGPGLRAVGGHVAGIRTLSVVSHTYSPGWIDAIVEAPGFASLEALEVRAHAATPPAAALARLRAALPALVRLNESRRPGTPTIPMDPSEP